MTKHFYIPQDNSFFKKHLKNICSIRISRIITEFVYGFSFLKKYDNTVTFFGSARLKPSSEYYQEARQMGESLSKKGYTVITGGGAGIMEAANRGAFEAGGKSIGINIKIPKEQKPNKYLTDHQTFHYFFIRKVMMAFACQAYIFFPGGFGTLDEFFEIITLVQTNKVKKIPIVLVHKDFWQPLLSWVEKDLVKKHKTVSKKDLEIFHLADNEKEALQMIEKLDKKYKKIYV